MNMGEGEEREGKMKDEELLALWREGVDGARATELLERVKMAGRLAGNPALKGEILRRSFNFCTSTRYPLPLLRLAPLAAPVLVLLALVLYPFSEVQNG